MKKLLFGLILLFMVGDAFAQRFNPIYTPALIIYEGSTQQRYLRLSNYDSYYNFTTSSGSNGIRFLPQGATSSVLTLSSTTATIAALTVTGTQTFTGVATFTAAITPNGGIGFTDGTDTYSVDVASDELIIYNDKSTAVALVEIDSTGKFELNGLLDGDGTGATLNNTLSDTLELNGAIEQTDGTDVYSLVVTSDELVIKNDYSTPAALVEIDSLGKVDVKFWLNVADTVKCDSIYTLATAAWADYVFEEGYDLPTIKEEIDHINKNGHLMSLNKADKNKKYVSDGDIQRRLEQSIEALEKAYLYISSLEKRLDKLEKK